MVEDVGVGATSLFQSISQDGQSVKGTLIVDAVSQLGDGAAVPSQPRIINKVESYLIMHHYGGFLGGSARIQGRR